MSGSSGFRNGLPVTLTSKLNRHARRCLAAAVRRQNLNIEDFDEVWFVDTEFIALPGERLDVVCVCAVELRSGRTIRLWRDQLGATPPYRTDSKVLFVCFVANAEHLADRLHSSRAPRDQDPGAGA